MKHFILPILFALTICACETDPTSQPYIDFYDYEDGNGFVEISETVGERISGTFSFSAKDLDDKTKTISGSFDMKAE